MNARELDLAREVVAFADANNGINLNGHLLAAVTLARDLIAQTVPQSVRELKEAEELRGHGIEREEYEAGARFWLATWADREGWYIEHPSAEPAGRFWAGVSNADEIFATHAEAQAWLWAHVEVQS